MSNFEQMIIAACFMAGLGLLLATLLAYANRRLYVFEDPRIDVVDELLSHSNCGACGTPGCRLFAEMLVEGSVTPGQCAVNSAEMNIAIWGLMWAMWRNSSPVSPVSEAHMWPIPAPVMGGSRVAVLRRWL
jgi:Na+-translocating ferredoxin:NAD+ oxidoreductase RNF subunit RnfB